ncbi:MAG TPA: ribonuclease P protein component [Bacteroidales bacterium]|nr:ribonuclease P protein component [Bacteroidales bacterium]HSA43383.1 ribonuclease P protein component [Bacteroidales bacterium]
MALQGHGFSKAERLCGESNITPLFRKGRTLYEHPFKVFFLVEKDHASVPPAILISIPKKQIKTAVTRNLLKRRIREAYRLNKTILPHFQGATSGRMQIALVYLSPKVLPFQEIRRKIILILQRLSAYENSPG